MLSARTIDSAPRSPPQERIAVQRRGSLSFGGRTTATPQVMTTLATVTITNAPTMRRQLASSVGSFTINPIDRKTKELSVNAA